MLRGIVADLLHARGLALMRLGRVGPALSSFAWAARLAPSIPFLSAAALAARQAGERDRAVYFGERALLLNPELPEMHALLSGLFMHGEFYQSLLARIHAHLKPRTYIEIGVETGASLRAVSPETLALGVDPQPAITFSLPPNVRVFAETSDQFFASHDVRAELGGLPVDLAFIDGMHHFEYALRDFMNLERLCARESTILVHDCFPYDRRTSERERKTAFWTGDVWRLVVLLKKHRPDLRIDTVAAPPTGLALIRNLDPSSRFLSDNLERLSERFARLDYRYLETQRAAKLNLFPNDWDRVRGLLAAPAA